MPSKRTGNMLLGGSSQGEIDEKAAGAIGTIEYTQGLKSCKNMLITKTLGTTVRGGFEVIIDDGALSGDPENYRIITMIKTDGTGLLLVLRNMSGAFWYILPIHDIPTSPSAAAPMFPAGFDVNKVRYSQYKNKMVIVCEGEEPIVFDADTELFTLFSTHLTGTITVPPWQADSDWPVGVSFMLSRFIFVSREWYYGTKAGDPFNFDELAVTIDGEERVTSSSAFKYNSSTDMDRGFDWIQGGMFAMAGSQRGTWVMSNFQNGLDATNPNLKNYSTLGTDTLPAIFGEGAFIYFLPDRKTAMIFTITPDGPINVPINDLSQHLFDDDPPIRMVLQTIPDTVCWIVTEKGNLISYQFGNNTTRRAWAPHPMKAKVYDVVVGTDTINQELFILTELNGKTQILRQSALTCTDSGAVMLDNFSIVVEDVSSNQSPTAETAGANGESVLTCAGHSFTIGMVVTLSGDNGINGTFLNIVVVDAGSVSLQRENLSLVEFGIGFDFEIIRVVQTVGNLALAGLEVMAISGHTAQISVADSSGNIPMEEAYPDVTFGLPYSAYIEPRYIGDMTGPNKGRFTAIFPHVYKTASFYAGQDLAHLTEKRPGTLENPYSGVLDTITIGGGSNLNPTFVIKAAEGAGLTVAYCYAQVEVN